MNVQIFLYILLIFLYHLVVHPHSLIMVKLVEVMNVG